MTEVTSSPIACNPLPPRQRKAGSVGVPMVLDVAIMDEGGALLPGGQTGQVVVRGASVTAGYDGNPKATEAAFAGDWFKTEDLGYFDDDGYLFLAGRIREIINRGGEKVAPQEVDEVLLDHPAVAEAVTFAAPHATLGEDVAAAVVLRPDAAATPKDIRQFATGRIADFKVPRQVLIVGEIPKGPTGKVQRIGLAAKLGLAISGALPRAFVAPRTPLEKALAKHWAESSSRAVGIHDDFFASGGDSLLATGSSATYTRSRRLARGFAVFGRRMLRRWRTISNRLAGRSRRLDFHTHCRVPRENGVVPASIAQEQLWKLQQALADLPFFNVLYALRLTSACDVAVLERSINEIVRRHEILRTTLAVIDGRPVQVIAPQLNVPLAFDDLRVPPSADEGAIGHQIIEEEMLHSFDLAQGPLIRTRLLRLAEPEYLLLISMHQVVCDGWSLGVFVEELVTLYDTFSLQEASPLPPLHQFGSACRNARSHAEIVAQLAYWREQLQPLPVIRLARPAVDGQAMISRRNAEGGRYRQAGRRRTLQPRGARHAVHGARGGAKRAAVAHRRDDPVATKANRTVRGQRLRPSLRYPRTNLGGDPNSREVLRRVRATTLAGFDNQDLPFAEIAETLERERATGPASLAQIMILLQNATLRPPARFEGTLACEEANPNMILPLVTTTTFDVILALVENNLGLAGTCIYKPTLFSAEEIDRLLQGFESVIEQMVEQPERPISAIRVLEMRDDRAGK